MTKHFPHCSMARIIVNSDTGDMTILRNCGAGDYAGVVQIYNDYVLHSHATFDLH